MEKIIEDFNRDGVVVIEDVLTPEEVSTARDAFHNQMRELGIDHDRILEGSDPPPETIRIKSPIAGIFYSGWKMGIQLHSKVHYHFENLLVNTYGQNRGNYTHPYGRFNKVKVMVERVGWRTPDFIRAEGGLALHLDRNPIDPYLKKSGGLKKWRPIQGFVALTDHYGGGSGGLRVVKGFHHQIDKYFKNASKVTDGGEFFRMNFSKYSHLEKHCQPLNVPAGSLVCWDSRLPHATCNNLETLDSREVVYMGYLPNIVINQRYISLQKKAIDLNQPPPQFSDKVLPSWNWQSDRDWDWNDLDDRKKSLLIPDKN